MFRSNCQKSVRKLSPQHPEVFRAVRNVFPDFPQTVPTNVWTKTNNNKNTKLAGPACSYGRYVQHLILVKILKHVESLKPYVLTLLDRYNILFYQQKFENKWGLSCVQRWSTTNKTVSSKVETTKTVNES